MHARTKRRLRAQAASAAPENRDRLAGLPVELGGGWWRLPDGRKVRGRDAAMKEIRP